MKWLLFIVFLAVITTSFYAQIEGVSWVKTFKGAGQCEVSSLNTDAFGNIFLSGTFNGSCDFDPDAGQYVLTGSDKDQFVIKLNAKGEFLWGKKYTSSEELKVWGLKTDSQGNVIFSGRYKGTVDFDENSTGNELFSNGKFDMFITKLSPTGELIWTEGFGSTGDDYIIGLDVDQHDQLYLTGHFEKTVDFDPSTNELILSSNGQKDIFVSKLNSNGELLFAFGLGDWSYDIGQQIKVANNGDILVLGGFGGLVDFDPSASYTALEDEGFADGFIARYSEKGDFIWARSVNSSSYSQISDITEDQDNNIYVTGLYMDTIDLDPGMDIIESISVGDADGFLLKIDALGNYIWSKTFGHKGLDSGNALISNSEGDIYLTGSFSDSTIFYGDTSDVLLTKVEGNQFIVKIDKNGVALGGQVLGRSEGRGHIPLNYSFDGSVYLGGEFLDSCDIDPSTAEKIIYSSDSLDGFLVKLNSSLVGINQINADASFTCYPNPVSSHLYLRWKSEGRTRVRLLSISGKEILNKTVEGNDLSLDTHVLQSGGYFIEWQQGDKVERKKVVKH